jgi:hypothetical protein
MGLPPGGASLARGVPVPFILPRMAPPGPPTLDLVLLPATFAVARLAHGTRVPAWALHGELTSITRTPEELSIVCAADAVPADARAERGWRAIRVAGTIDFALTGILASVLAPLAAAGISIFAVSTFDTDYVLVREAALDRALAALSGAGHRIAA